MTIHHTPRRGGESTTISTDHGIRRRAAISPATTDRGTYLHHHAADRDLAGRAGVSRKLGDDLPAAGDGPGHADEAADEEAGRVTTAGRHEQATGRHRPDRERPGRGGAAGRERGQPEMGVDRVGYQLLYILPGGPLVIS